MSDTKPASKADRYGIKRPKVPAFARFEGTSAWRHDRRRARAYALHLAALRSKAAATATA